MKAIGEWIRKATRQVLDPDREERLNEVVSLLYRDMQSAGEKFSLAQFKKECGYTDHDVELAKRRIYQTLLVRAWQDRKVTAAEQKTLEWVVTRLHIPRAEATQLHHLAARECFAKSLSCAMDDGALSGEEALQLEQIAMSVGMSLGEFVRMYFQNEGEDYLRGIFAACAEGGVLADDAWSRLAAATKRLGLSRRDLLSAVKVQAERLIEHVLADAKSDGELSESEERVLKKLITTFELDSESANYIKKSIAALQTIRNARRGKLPSLERPTGIAVRSGEIVHYHSPATWMQKRILKSGEQWDQHVGTVTITDNRLLFSSDTKSFDVRFGKIVSHNGATGIVRIQRMEKPESYIRVEEDEPIAYSIFEGSLALSNQTRLSQQDGAPMRHIPRDVRQRVWQRYGGRCAECSANQYLEFDHVIPVAKGGSNTDANVQLLCRKCNLKKSDLI